MSMEVVLSAPLLTIQDLGRHGWRHLGVPRCGVMDTLALQQANLLLGNDDNAAALEITSAPVLLRFTEPTRIVLMGADMHAALLASDATTIKKTRLWPGFVTTVEAGDCLRLQQAPVPGQRALLAVAGGFAVAPVMGSRSTDLINGFGGLQGRALRAGDKVPLGTVCDNTVRSSHDKTRGVRQQQWSTLLRILPAADFRRFDERARSALLETPWYVHADSNRMGLRLTGERLALAGNHNRQLSMGVLPGLIQVPADGQPIILAADAQTTGGYPAIASVISADLWQLAYLGPGTVLRFSEVSLAEAHGLRSRQQLQLNRLRLALGHDIQDSR